MVTPEETTTSDAVHEMDRHTKVLNVKRMYANVLPEHDLLRGHFFAREAEPCGKSLADSTKDAVVVTCPPAPKATLAAVQTTKEPAVQITEEPAVEAQEVTLTDSESESDGQDEILADPVPEGEAEEEAQTETEAEKVPLVEVEKEGENEDTRQQDAKTQEGEAEETQQEDEQKKREAEEEREAEVRRQEGRLRDPPLFPENWFDKAKYDPEERLVRL